MGRLLILIAAIINIILFFIFACWLVFDLVTRGEDFNVALNGSNAIVNIFDISLFILFILTFVWVTIWCIKNIVLARSMRHALIGTLILFVIELLYIFYHIFMPGVLVTNLGFFIGLSITSCLTTLGLTIGCAANYFKDCVN